jgi:predicted O-methyltransferase YrrM
MGSGHLRINIEDRVANQDKQCKSMNNMEDGNTRSRPFKSTSHNRYWWHRAPGTDYIPLPYAILGDAEWEIMKAWFEDTERRFQSTGEANIPPLSFLFCLISGNAIERVVQCGHYVGYSTLLLGFLFRQMGKTNALFSIDIDAAVTEYTAQWLGRAGLNEQVKLSVADSADPNGPQRAKEYFGGQPPQLVFIDSSHQYGHTMNELDLWYDFLPQGGLLVLHDTSRFAASFDSSGEGGVFRAVSEWCALRGITSLMLNSFVAGGSPGDYPYLDGCGLTIIQKSR